MSDERYEILVDQAEELDEGPEKIALVEEAVREADLQRDPYLSFMVRMDLVRAAAFGDAREKAVVAFSWCLAQFDAEPQRYGGEQYFHLLWRYKWILGGMAYFPQMSKQQ